LLKFVNFSPKRIVRFPRWKPSSHTLQQKHSHDTI